MERLVSIGRAFYGIAIVVFGLEHLVHADFVTRVVPTWPAWIPGRPLWAYTVGLALIAAGGAILGRMRTGVVARLLGGAMLLSVVCLHLPRLVANPNGGVLTSTFKGIALSGGAFAIAAAASGSRPLLWIGALFYGSFLFVAGVLHFRYVDFVATMVPAWIPGHVFWTYFAGVALMAGGAGINVPRTARLAATLSGAMIFTWFVVLHFPRVLAQPHNVNELTALFEALAMSGIAFVLAGAASTPTR